MFATWNPVATEGERRSRVSIATRELTRLAKKGDEKKKQKERKGIKKKEYLSRLKVQSELKGFRTCRT